MTDAIMLSVASAVAGKAAEAVTGALGDLARLIRRHLRGNADAVRALDWPPSVTVDQQDVHKLAQALEQAAAADPGFAASIQALWPPAQEQITARDGGTANTVTGHVGGHLIQARDLNVHGGIHLSGPQPS